MQILQYNSQNKYDNNFGINKLMNNRKRKSLNPLAPDNKHKDAATQLIQSKQFIKDQIANVTMIREKQMANLEKTRAEAVKNVKQICEKYSDSFKELKDMCIGLDKILNGDVDYVEENMSLQEVCSNINNAQIALITGSQDLLKEYYASGAASKGQKFEQYIMKNGNQEQIDKLTAIKNDGGIDFKKIMNEYIEATCKALEVLKKAYERVFSIDEKIEQCKGDTAKQIKDLNESLERLNYNLSESDGVLKNSDSKKKKHVNQLI